MVCLCKVLPSPFATTNSKSEPKLSIHENTNNKKFGAS